MNNSENSNASDDLPEGWCWAKLGEIVSHPKADIVDGPFGSDLKASEYIDEGVPIVRLQNVDRNRFIEKNIRYISPKKAKDLNRHNFKPGDVIVTKLGDPLGKACIVPENFGPGIVVADIVRVRLNHSFCSIPYLAYSINSQIVTGQFFQHIKGTTRPRVNLGVIRSLIIPLAPLSEQKRVVARVDELLGRVNSVRERLAGVQAILKRFRQSVLSAACSGRLTADWRKKNAEHDSVDAIFDDIQLKRREWYKQTCELATDEKKKKPQDPKKSKKSNKPINDLPQIPDLWRYYRLEDLCFLVTDGTHKTPVYEEKGIPFLSVKNVRPFLIKDNVIKFINEQEHNELISRCKPEKGDILYTKVGATFGYAAAVSLEYAFSIFVSLALIKPVNPFFTTGYAELVMNSEIIFAQARDRVSGIGTPDLHLIEIRDFKVSLPPVEEQMEIIQRVKKLFELADSIERKLSAATMRSERLTQAILAKAFRGALVPTEAELARREGRSYEPASSLWARIKAERDIASAPVSKKRKRRL